jgi:hypothetical protein
VPEYPECERVRDRPGFQPTPAQINTRLFVRGWDLNVELASRALCRNRRVADEWHEHADDLFREFPNSESAYWLTCWELEGERARLDLAIMRRYRRSHWFWETWRKECLREYADDPTANPDLRARLLAGWKEAVRDLWIATHPVEHERRLRLLAHLARARSVKAAKARLAKAAHDGVDVERVGREAIAWLAETRRVPFHNHTIGRSGVGTGPGGRQFEVARAGPVAPKERTNDGSSNTS